MPPTRQSDRPTGQLGASRAYGALKDEDYDVLPFASAPHPRRGFVLRPPELVGDGRSLELSECWRLHGRCDGVLLLSRGIIHPRYLTSCEREKCMAERGVAQGTKRIFIIGGPDCIRRNPG